MSDESSLQWTARAPLEVLTDPGAEREGLVVAFTDRRGGVSAAPWNWLNLSGRVGDEPADVQTNHGRTATALGVGPSSLRFADQVHGSRVLSCDGTDGPVVGEGDALVARLPGTTLSILTADCVPVLLRGERGIAAAHAGWRGLAAGVIEAAMAEVGPIDAAWVGPSIRACCYEVGREVIESFEAAGLPIEDDSHVDPNDAAAAILERGAARRVATASGCTSCDDRFFSHRRDGTTGRQGAFIALLG
jgi:YfiH family protein